MTEGASRIPTGFGVNLIAHASAHFSLGISARAYADALLQHGVPLSIVEVAHPHGEKRPTGKLAPYVARHVDDVNHPVNLYLLHADFSEILKTNQWLLAPGRLHAAVLWWETTSIPSAWSPHLRRLDAIIANSSFIANTVANNLPITPVLSNAYPFVLPTGVRPDRVRFGLPDCATVFCFSFNPNSDPARKNPLAVVQAFRQAFAASIEDVRLVIRVHHADADDLARRCVADIVRTSAGDARINLMLEPMSHEEVLSLYASSDVYVSLHRAEGLGMGMMESMALGKPVIATAWSGNMDFMAYSCGCPVRYRLMRAAGNFGFLQPEFLGPNALWADPVIEDAVAWMQRLHADPQIRQRLGAAAKRRIDAYQMEAQQCKWIDQLIALWQARSFMPKVADKYSSPTFRFAGAPSL